MCHLPGGWRLTVDVTVHCACTCVRRFNRSVSFVLQFKRVAFMHTISRRNCLWLVDWLRKRKPISETSSFRLRSFQISLKCVYFSFRSDLILFFLSRLAISFLCRVHIWIMEYMHYSTGHNDIGSSIGNCVFDVFDMLFLFIYFDDFWCQHFVSRIISEIISVWGDCGPRFVWLFLRHPSSNLGWISQPLLSEYPILSVVYSIQSRPEDARVHTLHWQDIQYLDLGISIDAGSIYRSKIQ